MGDIITLETRTRKNNVKSAVFRHVLVRCFIVVAHAYLNTSNILFRIRFALRSVRRARAFRTVRSIFDIPFKISMYKCRITRRFGFTVSRPLIRFRLGYFKGWENRKRNYFIINNFVRFVIWIVVNFRERIDYSTQRFRKYKNVRSCEKHECSVQRNVSIGRVERNVKKKKCVNKPNDVTYGVKIYPPPRLRYCCTHVEN